MEPLIPFLLLAWYDINKRDLPWRERPDPYAVWVSEIMLQQTRVETVIPYFLRWMARFPTVTDLAAASQQTVLSIWEGLGYYRRARNLHRAAQIIVEEFGGALPTERSELKRLPGIGRYSAGAIASIAFGRDEPVLDGNIRRVYARLFDVREPVGTSAAERRFGELAKTYLPQGRAGDYNQALMDLGAVICTPRSPKCSECPVCDLCRAYALGVQEARPVRKLKTETPHHIVTAAVIQKDSLVLIAQRPQDGLLGGMWEFPGGKLQPGEDLVSCLQREIREELGVEIAVQGLLGTFRHAYTHFRITLHAFSCMLVTGQVKPVQVEDIRWVPLTELQSYPMGKVDRQISQRLIAEAVT